MLFFSIEYEHKLEKYTQWPYITCNEESLSNFKQIVSLFTFSCIYIKPCFFYFRKFYRTEFKIVSFTSNHSLTNLAFRLAGFEKEMSHCHKQSNYLNLSYWEYTKLICGITQFKLLVLPCLTNTSFFSIVNSQEREKTQLNQNNLASL